MTMKRKVTLDIRGSVGIPITVLTGKGGFQTESCSISACRVVLGHAGRPAVSQHVTSETWLLKHFLTDKAMPGVPVYLDNLYKQYDYSGNLISY